MEYAINKLSKLSGVSTRTLRYYDEIKLLSPLRINSAGYRIYGEKEIDLLQQILFYRELGLPLNEIKMIIYDKNFDKNAALENHLQCLISKENQIKNLISTVNKTIKNNKGELIMSNEEKFNGFKQKAITENEEKFGVEIRKKYGDTIIDSSNEKFNKLTKKQYDKMQELSKELNATLILAVESKDYTGDFAKKAIELHKEWLLCTWPEGLYSKQAHLGLTQMYCDDERFKEYYEKIVPGAAEFLNEAAKANLE